MREALLFCCDDEKERERGLNEIVGFFVRRREDERREDEKGVKRMRVFNFVRRSEV